MPKQKHRPEPGEEININKEFLDFLEKHDPGQFSRNLRSLLLDHLHMECERGVPAYMQQLLWTLYDFFLLLDKAEKKLAD